MERLAEEMFEKVIYINEAMSRHEFVPKLPTEADLDLVFEVNYPDVQPYCFKVRLYLSHIRTHSSFLPLEFVKAFNEKCLQHRIFLIVER